MRSRDFTRERHRPTKTASSTADKRVRIFNLEECLAKGKHNEGVNLVDPDAPAIVVPEIVGAAAKLVQLETRKGKASMALGFKADEVESLPFDLSKLESEAFS